MEYLVWRNAKNTKKRAHIWNRYDTVCRMASTGGLNTKRYAIANDTRGFQLCSMCQKVADKANKIKRLPVIFADDAASVRPDGSGQT